MPLDALDHEVLRLQIMGFTGQVAGARGVIDYFFMGDDETGNEVFLRDRAAGKLVHAGGFRKFAEAAYGVGVQGTNALGDFINGFKQIFVMIFESFM